MDINHDVVCVIYIKLSMNHLIFPELLSFSSESVGTIIGGILGGIGGLAPIIGTIFAAVKFYVKRKDNRRRKYYLYIPSPPFCLYIYYKKEKDEKYASHTHPCIFATLLEELCK